MAYADPEQKRRVDAARYAANREHIKRRRMERHHANPKQTQTHSLAWRAANPEAARVMAFAAASNRRARLAGRPGKLSSALLAPLVDRCAYCGSEEGRGYWDHVVPFCRGGSNTVDNLLPSCLPCNQRKARRLPTAAERALLRRFLAARGIHSATRSSPLPSRSQRRPTPERNRT